MRRLLILASLGLGMVLAAIASGEFVHMKDGRTFEGEILKRSSSSIEIRTKVAGIETTLTLRRSEIDSISESAPRADDDENDRPAAKEPQREPAPETAPVRKKAVTPARTNAAQRSERLHYIEIPINGTFGENVLPTGVRDALEYAARMNVEHIVFHIDSPGGYVAAAETISETLRENEDRFTYHALVDDAISAAIWVVVMCDTIHMRPGASVGGAVVFSQDETTGAAEVDAKMNSIIAANLASAAAARGHHPSLIRAMILPEKEIFLWEDESGVTRIAEERSEAGPGARSLDDSESILTLTSDEAELVGFASILEGDSGDLGEALGFRNWRKRSEYGAAAMRRAERQAKMRGNSQGELVKRLNAVYASLNRLIEQANAAAPEGVSLTIYRESGLLTPGSVRRWQKATDESIALWEQVMSGLKELRKISRELESIGLSAPIEERRLRDIANQAERRLRELRENRDRRYR